MERELQGIFLKIVNENHSVLRACPSPLLYKQTGNWQTIQFRHEHSAGQLLAI